jgi:hypothetical protein
VLKRLIVVSFVLAFLAAAHVFWRGRTDTALEVLALRQQVAVLKRRRPRPPLSALDRLFWTVLRETWARWEDVLVIVKPETSMIRACQGKNTSPCTRRKVSEGRYKLYVSSSQFAFVDPLPIWVHAVARDQTSICGNSAKPSTKIELK